MAETADGRIVVTGAPNGVLTHSAISSPTSARRRCFPGALDTVRVFGGDDSGPATFHEVRQGLVDVDAQGRIFVLEPFEYRVTVFDSVGRALSTMGRRGEGPGELEWPISVSAADDGHAYVHDGAGQLVRLALDQLKGTDSPLKHSVINMGLRHAEVTPAGILIWARAVSAWGGFRVDVLEGHGLVRSIRWAGVGEDRLSRSEAEAYLEAQGYLGPCDDDVGETIEKHGFHHSARRWWPQ